MAESEYLPYVLGLGVVLAIVGFIILVVNAMKTKKDDNDEQKDKHKKVRNTGIGFAVVGILFLCVGFFMSRKAESQSQGSSAFYYF